MSDIPEPTADELPTGANPLAVKAAELGVPYESSKLAWALLSEAMVNKVLYAEALQALLKVVRVYPNGSLGVRSYISREEWKIVQTVIFDRPGAGKP